MEYSKKPQAELTSDLTPNTSADTSAPALASKFARHHSGLQYTQEYRPEYKQGNEAKAHSAVICVKTPSVDHSGLAHACEHLVFRRSYQFPNPNTLFQLTQQLDLKINASTCANVTFFHVESDHESHFLLALNYLFAGMWQPQLSELDIKQEIFSSETQSGVIFHELLGFETLPQNQSYRDWSNIIRQDNSPNCIHHYGGFSDTIKAITLAHVQEYFDKFYQPHNTQLLMASNIEIQKVLTIVSNNLANPKPEHRQKAPAKADSNNNREQPLASLPTDSNPLAPTTTHILHTWWLPNWCYTVTQQLLSALSPLGALGEVALSPLSEATPPHAFLPLKPTLNARNEFPLRLIFSEDLPSRDLEAQFHAAIQGLLKVAQSTLDKLNIEGSINGNTSSDTTTTTPIYLTPDFIEQRKYSPTVKNLILKYFANDFALQEQHQLDRGKNTSIQYLKQLITTVGTMPSTCSVALPQLATSSKPHNLKVTQQPASLFIANGRQQLIPEIVAMLPTKQPSIQFSLPEMLLPLYAQLQQQTAETLHNQQPSWMVIESSEHWLAAIPFASHKQKATGSINEQAARQFASDIACSPRLLSQRTRGHCYATGCQYDPKTNFIIAYGVFGILK